MSGQHFPAVFHCRVPLSKATAPHEPLWTSSSTIATVDLGHLSSISIYRTDYQHFYAIDTTAQLPSICNYVVSTASSYQLSRAIHLPTIYSTYYHTAPYSLNTTQTKLPRTYLLPSTLVPSPASTLNDNFTTCNNYGSLTH